MATLTITPGSVMAGAGASPRAGTAGETITAGMPVYKDAADNKYKKSSANGATTDGVDGIALNNASNNQPLDLCTSGPINLGATLVVGQSYYLDPTAGLICDVGDVSTGFGYVTKLGIATAANNLDLEILVSGVLIP